MEERSPVVAREYYTRLHQRIAEILTKDLADEQRIIQEAAIFADKSNITEEIVRLKSHINHLKDLMDGESVGRKCDFLVQEMFRETNTIASKGNDLEISQIVVDIKAELEKIREQLQNIEYEVVYPVNAGILWTLNGYIDWYCCGYSNSIVA